MRLASRVLAGACVLAVLAGFFLPWVTVQLAQPEALGALGAMLGRVRVTVYRDGQPISGDVNQLLQEPITLTGAQIPARANEQSVQAVEALLEMATRRRYYAGEKSQLVYLMPGIALVCAAAVMLLPIGPPVAFTLAGLCAFIAAGGFWKLLTLQPPPPPATLTIGPGLWLSLWAYVGLTVAALLRAR